MDVPAKAAEPAFATNRFPFMEFPVASRPIRRLAVGGVVGFAAGVLLAGGLLEADAFKLATLVAAERFPPAVAGFFALGLGVVLAPVGVATGLALAAVEDSPE